MARRVWMIWELYDHDSCVVTKHDPIIHVHVCRSGLLIITFELWNSRRVGTIIVCDHYS